MIRLVRRMLDEVALRVCAGLATCLVWHVASAAVAKPLPSAEIDRVVVAAIPAWQGKPAEVLDRLDLSEPFATVSQWTLVVALDPDPSAMPGFTDPGALAVCLVKTLAVECSEKYGPTKTYPWTNTAYVLRTAKVVHAGARENAPLLLLQTCSTSGMNGNCDIRTVLYAYSRAADRFHPVFVNDTRGSNNNQDARFVEYGPLRGDAIVNYPTDHAPYAYWIEVYARRGVGDYTRILRYRGHTGYGDGNVLAVADSEMPEILRRLGKWQLGDALPVPPQSPKGCGRLILRRGVEWCDFASR